MFADNLPMQHLMKIGEMSKLFGISIDTLRHYDRIGLLKPIVDPENNYRYYSTQHIPTLKIIQFGKNADLSLEQLKEHISEGTLESYLKILEKSNKNIIEKRKLLEAQEKYCKESTCLLSKIAHFENNFELKDLKPENININIYTINIEVLNTIHVYPRTIEETQSIEQWILYPKGRGFETASPEDELIHSFSYRTTPSTKIFENAMIEQVKQRKASRSHFSGFHYKIEFWGTHKELADYIDYLFEHFKLSEQMILPIHYLYSLPEAEANFRHFVEIYVPVL